jgi:tRNA threonylcarbamoyladenosine biosynthesis protein TsaE
MTCAISTTSSEATQAVARRLGKLLHGGELIELSSDLGGGKTTFTQGLAQGLGYDGEVTSPTFTLSQIYRVSDDLELHHYDLYRLGETGVVGDELAEDLTDPHLVTVIEWAGIIEHDLPADRLTITIEVTGDEDRTLHLESGGPVSSRLVEAMQ